MSWVVDTCLIIDVLEADPDFGEASAELLDSMMVKGFDMSCQLCRTRPCVSRRP